MYALLFILFILVGLFIKKRIKIYDLLIIFFLCVVSYNSKNVADFENYKAAYDYIALGYHYVDLGEGWRILCVIGAKFGFDYLKFKTIIILISCLLIRNTVNHYIKDYKISTIIWSLYMLYPALLDLVQVRFFLAEAVVLFALRFLTGEKKGYIKYILFIILAYMIHSSSIFYLLFLFSSFFDRINKKAYYIVIFGFSLFIMLFNNQIISIASLFFDTARINRYLYSSDGVGFFGVIAYIFTIVVFLNISRGYKNRSGLLHNKSDIKFIDLFYSLNIMSFIIFTLSFFDTNLFRLQRPLWLLMYIAGGIMIKNDVNYSYLFNVKMKTSNMLFMLALIGNMFYICIFTFNIVKSFLL